MNLVFDTETTGLPRYGLPAEHPSQPRICQLAAVLFDDHGNEFGGLDLVIKPEGWIVPEAAAAVHGLTTEICEQRGVPIREALEHFLALFDRADLLIAYGIPFDTKLLRGEIRRARLAERLVSKPQWCALEAATQACALPPTDRMMAAGIRDFKRPKLGEAVKVLLDEELVGAHSASADARATKRIFLKLRDRFPPSGAVRAAE